VTLQDEHCLNCGIVKPHADKKIVARMEEAPSLIETAGEICGSAGMVIGAVIGAIIGAFLGWSLDGLFEGMTCLIPGVISGALFGTAYGWCFGEQTGTRLRQAWRLRFRRRAGAYLQEYEETIQERLEEFVTREHQLQESRRRVEQEGAADQWQSLRGALDHAAATLRRQRDRYLAKAWEIELVRWHNTLEPLASGWDGLTHDQCTCHLLALDFRRRTGEEMRRDWMEAEVAGTPDGQDCIRRLDHGLSICEELRQGLVAEQAILALRAVSPMEPQAPPVPALAAARRQSDRLGVRTELGEFCQAFKKLEAEYPWFQARDEVSRMGESVQYH
jgi:hypothetical protein